MRLTLGANVRDIFTWYDINTKDFTMTASCSCEAMISFYWIVQPEATRTFYYMVQLEAMRSFYCIVQPQATNEILLLHRTTVKRRDPSTASSSLKLRDPYVCEESIKKKKRKKKFWIREIPYNRWISKRCRIEWEFKGIASKVKRSFSFLFLICAFSVYRCVWVLNTQRVKHLH